ncbi:hypothetical protein GUITHDRAFT_148289 [Guillardia theta CCMP2712]|uniref:Uncharacterized protein n=1 Tax=Guillardia theta (strain CCMP2712) TaxID=905079 RepID=L1I9K9_GUITC|nr:hypothetical protein GUITHDRAFT_148289 [Guillardia theta CCMP2712]EKX32908.1 hypothetical protein GUITHDRAFT_148289 [Guillardia theta CCMP2712]|eukprot:XP_005819888.1 hypothetical protein GUITHDRAFT_148289 [Guillardia theta CCMP2712]
MNTNGHFNNAISTFLKELNEFDEEKYDGIVGPDCTALSKSCYTIRTVWNCFKDDQKLHHWYLLYVLQPDLQRAVSHITSRAGYIDDAVALVNLSYLPKEKFEVNKKMECVTKFPEQVENFVFYIRTARAVLREIQESLYKTKKTRMSHRIELANLIRQTVLLWNSFTCKQQQFYIELVMLFTPFARSIALDVKNTCPEHADHADMLCIAIGELESCNGQKAVCGYKRQRTD